MLTAVRTYGGEPLLPSLLNSTVHALLDVVEYLCAVLLLTILLGDCGASAQLLPGMLSDSDPRARDGDLRHLKPNMRR